MKERLANIKQIVDLFMHENPQSIQLSFQQLYFI